MNYYKYHFLPCQNKITIVQKEHFAFRILTRKLAYLKTKLPVVANIAKTKDFVTR